AEFYRNHMLTEEREVLPLLIAHFTEEDWARADAGIRAEMDPIGGTRPGGKQEDFARIFSKLVAAAPPPIGFGSGPYKNAGSARPAPSARRRRRDHRRHPAHQVEADEAAHAVEHARGLGPGGGRAVRAQAGEAHQPDVAEHRR